MQLLGLKSLVRPNKYRSYRGGINSNVPNVLDRQFRADQPNQKWVTDVTEFNVRGDKLYLSPVIDLYNGEIVAYETRRTPQLPLVSNMLKRALSKLGDHQIPLLHSNQGWQYQMQAYRSRADQDQVKRTESSSIQDSVLSGLTTRFKYPTNWGQFITRDEQYSSK
jgi:putative transposase